ncbi:hypothetical protein PVAP13_4KG081966 [Panicum virgatum]|uniref:Uncharacterized protein n=1 Tax=Panicum virgatum TaxID=38727 RepID=A0A8T0TE44_PANVG|nr:hypothetical protein PVAP13_4KG081966 [Panicum virgatum]
MESGRYTDRQLAQETAFLAHPALEQAEAGPSSGRRPGRRGGVLARTLGIAATRAEFEEGRGGEGGQGREATGNGSWKARTAGGEDSRPCPCTGSDLPGVVESWRGEELKKVHGCC